MDRELVEQRVLIDTSETFRQAHVFAGSPEVGFVCKVDRFDHQRVAFPAAAGSGAAVLSGVGGPALAAGLPAPMAIAFDAAQNLYVSAGKVYRINASGGIITTVAGGCCTFSGDGGPAVNAGLYRPAALAFDAAGNLFIVDSSTHRIRAIRGPIP